MQALLHVALGGREDYAAVLSSMDAAAALYRQRRRVNEKQGGIVKKVFTQPGSAATANAAGAAVWAPAATLPSLQPSTAAIASALEGTDAAAAVTAAGTNSVFVPRATFAPQWQQLGGSGRSDGMGLFGRFTHSVSRTTAHKSGGQLLRQPPAQQQQRRQQQQPAFVQESAAAAGQMQQMRSAARQKLQQLQQLQNQRQQQQQQQQHSEHQQQHLQQQQQQKCQQQCQQLQVLQQQEQQEQEQQQQQQGQQQQVQTPQQQRLYSMTIASALEAILQPSICLRGGLVKWAQACGIEGAPDNVVIADLLPHNRKLLDLLDSEYRNGISQPPQSAATFGPFNHSSSVMSKGSAGHVGTCQQCSAA
jgi:hypothetical protein